MAWPSAAQATVLRVPASTRAGVLEAVRAGQPVRLRDPQVGEGDLGLPDRPQRPLAVDPAWRRSPGVPFSTRKPLTLPSASSRAHSTTTSAMVPLPIHFFRPLITQLVAVAAGRGLQRDRVRTVQRLGQREGAELLQLGHRRQPALLLLLRAEHGDRLHRQPGLHPEEGAQAAVAAVEFHVDQPDGDRAHRRAAVPLDAVADDAQLAHPLDQRPGELGVSPSSR